MIEAISLSIQTDLREFSHYLRQQGINHRITEESGQQVIYVATDEDAALVRQHLAGFQPEQWHGPDSTDSSSSPSSPIEPSAAWSQDSPTRSARGMAPGWLKLLLESPVTAALIAACGLVAVVSSLGAQAQRVEFLFYPLVSADGVLALLADINTPAELLRSLTPMFLHFGELHLVFNMLWLWYFGRQLEAIQPAWVFALLIVITAFVSNTTQFLFIQYNNFGGMSGVVYGLVGYTWVIHVLMPRSNLLIRSNMFVVFVAALVVMELLAGSWIATAAHVGGLVSGLLLGLLVVLYYRFVLNRHTISRHDR